MDNADGENVTLEKKKNKKDKVRSAWISFAGRIVAQMVGAIATVALGVMVLHRYTGVDAQPPASGSQPRHANVTATLEAPPAARGQTGGPPIVIVVTPSMLGLRDGDERLWSANRTCAPALDAAATSAAHFDNGTFAPR
jgi:hypothetical protein